MPTMPKNAEKYICDYCNFKCSKYSNYKIHLSTSKHKNRTISNILEQKNADNQYICKHCGIAYKARNSLWYHEKRCEKQHNPEEKCDDEFLTNLVLEVVKSNAELQKQNEEFKTMIMEQNNKMLETFQEVCKGGIGNNNNINSNNKAFNLNVFLNEECKDAMSITDFVNSIKLQLSDLEAVGKLGFVNGISNIIIKNLKALDVHMRPVHCTDTKRETMYVKGQDAWEKEGDDNKQLRLAIKRVAKNNFCCLELFKEKHPDCINWDSKHGDHYLKLRIEALGGRGNEDRDNENKIIRKIAREMTIDKNM